LETIPKNKINLKKYVDSFDNKGTIDFKNFKHILQAYYKEYGFSKIEIDKEKSFMLHKDRQEYAYIYAELNDNSINLEVYNAPEFNNDEYNNGFYNTSEGNYTSKEIKILIKQLDNLLNLEKEEGIAISLQGSWGIGKTFFWNQYITDKFDNTKFVNISLFGINSLEDIKKQIVLKIYDSNKISNFLENNPIINKFIESKWGIDASLIASSFKKDDFKNIVVCFDDFERISPNLSLSEILGFISELKEQYNCKIVLINNNNMLKNQDDLNHKKHIRKNKNDESIERFFTTQTNNQEVFDAYTEKIIDVTLKYEPHLKDNIRFLKEKSIDKPYIDWELLEKLFSSISDDNKKLNIRLMKQVLMKVELIQTVLSLKKINKKIKNGILVEIVKEIVSNKIDLTYLDIEVSTPHTLKKSFESIVKKHSVDLEFFESEINKHNSITLHDDNKSVLYNQIHDTYFNYLYGLLYDDSSFVKDFYELLNTPDIDVVQLVGLSSFEFYIKDFLKKLDSENDAYDTLFLEKSKIYIKNNIDNLENLDMFSKQGVNRVLDDYKELQKYYTDLKNETVEQKTNSKEEIKEIIKKLLSDKGWSKQTEELLSNVDSKYHYDWMISDREYFELIFNFVSWAKGFSGDKPFNEMYKNIMHIYFELSKNSTYQYKLKFILDRFSLSSKEIYENYISMPNDTRYDMLRSTAEEWAHINNKKYIEGAYTPIHEFDSGFKHYLSNEKPDIHYLTIDLAMKEYFNDTNSSGKNFFE